MNTTAPARPPRLIVFTDLDGTLLDHESYEFAPARPALAALRAAGAVLVPASSKTAAELAEWRARLGCADAPAIVENGAGVLWPGETTAGDDAAYRRIRAALGALPPALGAGFAGFGDWSVDEITRRTGLPAAAAARAKARRFSEPGVWTGSAAARDAFLAALAERGVTARAGGRFLTLSFGASKADRMAEVSARLAPGGGVPTVALGDAPNDAEMIAAADTGVIVANPAGPGLPPLAGEADGRIRRTLLPGPAGWNRAILDILDALDNTETATGRKG